MFLSERRTNLFLRLRPLFSLSYEKYKPGDLPIPARSGLALSQHLKA